MRRSFLRKQVLIRLQKGFLGNEEGGRSEKKPSGSWMPQTLVGGWLVGAEKKEKIEIRGRQSKTAGDVP